MRFWRSGPNIVRAGQDRLKLKIGYNEAEDKFFIAIVDRKTKDAFRVWIPEEGFKDILKNMDFCLKQTLKDKELR